MKADVCGVCCALIKYANRVSDAKGRVMKRQEMVQNMVRKQRIKWYGHITRMNNERWPSIAHNWMTQENNLLDAQSNGACTNCTLYNIDNDLKRASLSLYGIATGHRLEKLVGDR